MITIKKSLDGDCWEWEQIKEDGSKSTVGGFDTLEEAEADLKKRGMENYPTAVMDENIETNKEQS